MFFAILTVAHAGQEIRKQERDFFPDEIAMVNSVQKYYPNEKFDSKAVELQNYNTETKRYTSITVYLKSLSNPNFKFEYNTRTGFIHYSKSEGKTISIDGFYALDDNDLFQYERMCGISSCDSSINKNGKKIH